MKLRIVNLACVATLLCWFQVCVGNDGTRKDVRNSTYTLKLLQDRHVDQGDVFVAQEELDSLIREGGGGACASAAGIDVLQALRVMVGQQKLSNPHRAVLASFADQPALLDGRVTNEQFEKLTLEQSAA